MVSWETSNDKAQPEQSTWAETQADDPSQATSSVTTIRLFIRKRKYEIIKCVL